VSGRARLASWVLLVVSVILALFGIGDVTGGVTVDPGITLALTGLTPGDLQAAEPTAYAAYDFTTRTQGINLIAVGLALSAIVIGPYRAGRPWAWVAMWILPGWSILVFAAYVVFGLAPGQPPPPPMVSGPIVAILTAAVLIADAARFRAERSAVAPAT
jgi:hypothetical protein